MKLPYTEVKFYPEVKSQTGLSSLRVSCKRAQRYEESTTPRKARLKMKVVKSVRKYENMFQCVWSLSENGKEPSIKWKIVKMVSTIKQLYLSAN